MNLHRLAILMTMTISALVCGGEVTTVALHSTVRMSEPGVCTLAMIAQIDGPQARELGELEIDTPIYTGSWTHIKVEDIRKMLQDTPRIRAGSVVVTGTETHITRRVSINLKDSPPAPTAQQAKPTSTGPTLHDRVEHWLARRFAVANDAIRMQFHSKDAELLAQSAQDRIVEISPIGSSSRMALRVTVYAGERVESSFTITVEVEIRRESVVTTKDIARSTIIDESMISQETQWFSPFVTPVNPKMVLGQACRSRLRAGTVILADDLESPVVIERGEIVSARSIAGSVVVNIRARAMSNVRDGELFELESLDRKSRFTARASGPGRAVIIKKDETHSEGASR